MTILYNVLINPNKTVDIDTNLGTMLQEAVMRNI